MTDPIRTAPYLEALGKLLDLPPAGGTYAPTVAAVVQSLDRRGRGAVRDLGRRLVDAANTADADEIAQPGPAPYVRFPDATSPAGDAAAPSPRLQTGR